ELLPASDQLHAARLAAAPRVDLRLDDPGAASQALRATHDFAHRGRHAPVRYLNSVLGEQRLGLILVQIHFAYFRLKRRRGLSLKARVFANPPSSLVAQPLDRIERRRPARR